MIHLDVKYSNKSNSLKTVLHLVDILFLLKDEAESTIVDISLHRENIRCSGYSRFSVVRSIGHPERSDWSYRLHNQPKYQYV